MHLSLPLFNFTQWKDKCTSYSFTTKKLTHSMCQVSLVVRPTKRHLNGVSLAGHSGPTLYAGWASTYAFVRRSSSYDSIYLAPSRENVFGVCDQAMLKQVCSVSDKAPSQPGISGHCQPTSETPSNGGSLAGRWWSAFVCLLG